MSSIRGNSGMIGLTGHYYLMAEETIDTQSFSAIAKGLLIEIGGGIIAATIGIAIAEFIKMTPNWTVNL